MGKGYRQGRLGEEIRRIISELLISGIKAEYLIDGKFILLQSGKKNYFLITVK